MICVTGDKHGDINFFKDTRLWMLTKEDTLIIAGDFGYLFLDSIKEEMFLDKLAEEDYTICFVDGNHDNIPAISRYPEVIFNGGKAHKIRKNIYHLERGEIYNIENKKILTFGGAYSIDRHMRIDGVTLFSEELPREFEYQNCLSNLKKNNYCVDYIITHQGPSSLITTIFQKPLIEEEKELTEFLEELKNKVNFKCWYFGHWHKDIIIDSNFRELYNDLVALR